MKLRNVTLSFESPDFRHALICEDVSKLELDFFDAQQAEGAESVIRFHKVKPAMIRGCMPSAGTNNFIKVLDGKCEEITLLGNDFSRVN